MVMNYGGKTDIGLKRETNQDFFSIENLGENLVLFTVCDGMGGAKGGSEASRLCNETFCCYIKENIASCERAQYIMLLQKALSEANAAVRGKSLVSKEFEGMGTTLVSAIFDGEKYYLIWVGDSRIYAISESGIKQISHDHSFVQSLVDNGSITAEEAKHHPNRNIITKAVGIEDEIEGDVCEISAENFDGILLCSDGLCGYVQSEDIFEVINGEKDAEKCCDRLIELSNAAGGHDNITAVVHKKQ